MVSKYYFFGASLSAIDSFVLIIFLGAVMAVRQIANPVLLSRKIMDNTMHCALTGEGALKYARSINFPVLDNSNKLIDKTTSLGREIRYEDFERYADYYLKGTPVIAMDQPPEGGGDTVTVVAMDKNGQLACATSTGKASPTPTSYLSP